VAEVQALHLENGLQVLGVHGVRAEEGPALRGRRCRVGHTFREATVEHGEAVFTRLRQTPARHEWPAKPPNPAHLNASEARLWSCGSPATAAISRRSSSCASRGASPASAPRCALRHCLAPTALGGAGSARSRVDRESSWGTRGVGRRGSARECLQGVFVTGRAVYPEERVRPRASTLFSALRPQGAPPPSPAP
jgi:hypothetical protein